MKNFTNIYPQSKTLKFELRPQGASSKMKSPTLVTRHVAACSREIHL